MSEEAVVTFVKEYAGHFMVELMKTTKNFRVREFFGFSLRCK
jgi:hypothetical protein